MPASYVDKEFSVCDSELQDVVGVYTGTDGKSASRSPFGVSRTTF